LAQALWTIAWIGFATTRDCTKRSATSQAACCFPSQTRLFAPIWGNRKAPFPGPDSREFLDRPDKLAPVLYKAIDAVEASLGVSPGAPDVAMQELTPTPYSG
jgi:hypothetical protein